MNEHSWRIVAVFAVGIFLCQHVKAQELPPANGSSISLETTKANQQMSIDDLGRVQSAFNHSKSGDNALRYPYHPTTVYKVRMRVYMDTIIVLPEDEEIREVSLGDVSNFKFVTLVSSKNMGVLKGLYPGADTNLIIVSDKKRVYNFYLRIDKVDSPFLPHHVVYINDDSSSDRPLLGKKAEAEASVKTVNAARYKSPSAMKDYLRKINQIPKEELWRNQDLDFRYTIYLDNALIQPLMVFDDGYWTYFRLSEEENLDSLSDIFLLLKLGVEEEEAIKDWRISGGYLIAESLSDVWILRQGKKFTCVQKSIDDEKNLVITN